MESIDTNDKQGGWYFHGLVKDICQAFLMNTFNKLKVGGFEDFLEFISFLPFK